MATHSQLSANSTGIPQHFSGVPDPKVGAQWLSGRVLDSRPKGRGFEPHRRHCVVSLSKNINPSLVLVQPRKTRPFITERLLMGRKESNQTNKQDPKAVFQRWRTPWQFDDKSMTPHHQLPL